MAKGEDDILNVFGDGGSAGRQGMLRFYDADVVLFPVISDQGTVWVSTADRLDNWVCPNSGVHAVASDDKVVILKGLPNGKPVNLGW
jgi:CRISPR-associated protein Cmr4